MTPVVRIRRLPFHQISFASLLALCMCVAVRIPVAMSADAYGPNTWSIQLHGGLFTPTDGNGASPMLGMRYCKHYSPLVYGGMLTGWTWKRTTVNQPSQDPSNAGAQVELAQVDAQLIPLMGFVQVKLWEGWLTPLAGIGCGYEWFKADVRDHRAGTDVSSMFGNFAWETYGGLALRMTNKVRLNGELYYNGASLERKVIDATGTINIEALQMNGVGIRFGLDMDFE